MSILAKVLKKDRGKVYKACIKIYEETKRAHPGKPEIEYLRTVLMTKPPWDLHSKREIDAILECNETIQDLARFIQTYRLKRHCF